MSDAEREAFRQELIDKALNDDVRKAGEAFLAENRGRAGVVERPSGLQFRILSEAEGPKPGLEQVVEVAYEGRLVSGEIFAQASEAEPARFPLKQVIKGWREGMPLMSVGSEYEFYLPAELAYGATSPSPQIPANSALIFKIKLLRIIDERSEES